MADKKIIGIVGLMASGKGEAARYIVEKYGASSFRFSTMLKDVLDRYYLPDVRENYVIFSEIMRNAFGQDIMSKVIANDIVRDEHDLIVIEGIRRVSDAEHLRALPGFVLVKIVASPETRYDRLVRRDEKPDDRTKTYEQFLTDQNFPTERSIAEIMDQAEISIDNNGSVEDFHRQLDKIVLKS
jgi:dephospho-CoA kinase